MEGLSMPRNMFGDVVDPSVKMGNKSGYTVVLTMVAEVAIVLAVLIVPLLASGTLPMPRTEMTWTVTSVKLPSPPPPPRRENVATNPVPSDPSVPPREVPDVISPEPPREDRTFERDGDISGEVPGGGKTDLEPPAPPSASKEAPKEPLRIGGDVKAPQKVKHVNPVYPPIAQSARVQGIVIIEATISPTGDVVDARVLRSIPLLDEAAKNAVLDWKFTPTLLNNTPVPVVMTVTVQFTLQ